MRTRTSRTTRKSVKLVIAVPLVALGLSGLTACEFGSDDKAEGTKPGASATSDAGKGKPDDKNTKPGDQPSDKPSGKASDKPSTKPGAKDDKPAADPVSSDKLAEVLLNAQEVPAGFIAGDVDTSVDPTTTDNEVSDPRCKTLVSDNVDKDSTGRAEREFKKETLDADDQEGVSVSLVSHDADELEKRLGTYITAIKACASFSETDGTDVWDYEISDVRTGTYGADSVSYRLSIATNGQEGSYGYVVAARRGSIGMTVASFSNSAPPPLPTQFVTGQIQKVEDIA